MFDIIIVRPEINTHKNCNSIILTRIMMNKKLNLVLFLLALTIIMPLHLPMVIAQTIQVQNNSNNNWEKAFEDLFNQ
ncbi:MAG: hypothetical protein F6K17_33620 [Okeania sp. SIO3C4]|nr:hypothetical protein [Okeania sp. SIO3B3]NER07169.1 hypothetical protein [Okeania sp. SIO3C4]